MTTPPVLRGTALLRLPKDPLTKSYQVGENEIIRNDVLNRSEGFSSRFRDPGTLNIDAVW